MLEVNPRIQKWDPDQDITKGSQLIGQWQFAVHVGPGPMDHDLDTLVIKDKGHYLSPLQERPSFWRPFHSESPMLEIFQR